MSMKRRVGFVRAFVIGATLGTVGLLSNGALAQTAVSGTDAMAQADPVPYWWFHGTVEAGGRFFLNNPQNGYQTSNGPSVGCGVGNAFTCPGVAGKSLGGYYQYSDIKPGAFSNFDIATGTKNGLYQIEAGGKNVGYDDQSYYFDFSKAGEHYFNFMWDQTPHTYSTNALTPYIVSGNSLTLPPGDTFATSQTSRTLAPFAVPTDIGIRRDTASAQYRWTPDDAWDFRADYSHMDRTGTQPGYVYNNNGLSGFGGIQLPKPVDDTTQNYGINGEYAGTSPWGQRFTFKAGYTGSTYTDKFSGYTVQSFNTTQVHPSQISTWPSNQANGFDATLAADLPWKSRYAGTLSFTRMTQDDAFIAASTTNPYTLPAPSLGGAIDTILSNNVLTTKITSELTSKLTYRYYDFNNRTPELAFAGPVPVVDGGTSLNSLNSIAMGYIKQNAGAALNWRPAKEWNLGAEYGFERYDWTRADVDVTNENSGKLYGDWKPASWFTLRASGSYGARRYDNYNYQGYVGFFQWGCPGASCNSSELYASSYRQLMVDDRDQWKANLSADVVVVDRLTVTPTLKYIESKYGVDPTTQQGLQDSRNWSAGADVTYVLNPSTSFMVGYMYEWGSQLLYGINCTESSTTGAQCVAPQTLTNDTTTVHTFTALVRYAAIPDKLDTELRYTASHGTDNMNLFVGGALPSGGQFPQDSTWFQRLDATATYTFDKDQIEKLGWKGKVKAKLHYVWERNSVSDWAQDPLTPYAVVSGSASSDLYMAWYNPNYNVHMLMASLIASW